MLHAVAKELRADKRKASMRSTEELDEEEQTPIGLVDSEEPIDLYTQKLKFKTLSGKNLKSSNLSNLQVILNDIVLIL